MSIANNRVSFLLLDSNYKPGLYALGVAGRWRFDSQGMTIDVIVGRIRDLIFGRIRDALLLVLKLPLRSEGFMRYPMTNDCV